MTLVYLCGPIDEAKPETASFWRDQVAKTFGEHGIMVFDPYQAYSPVNQPKDKDALLDAMSSISAIDLAAVKVADGMLLYVDPNLPTCGSWIELGVAIALGKPMEAFTSIDALENKLPLFFRGLWRGAGLKIWRSPCYAAEQLCEKLGHATKGL